MATNEPATARHVVLGGGIAISSLERQHILEQLDQLMAELEQSTEISQGAIDGVVEIYAILGVKYEQQR